MAGMIIWRRKKKQEITTDYVNCQVHRGIFGVENALLIVLVIGTLVTFVRHPMVMT